MNISVIIPSYNRAHTLARSLDSVINQTFPATNIIVVDDGSNDGTDDLIHNKYSNISYLYQENGGVSSARNRGILASSTDWLAFLDSDDEWLPEKLERQVQELDRYPDYRIIHNDELWIRNGERLNPKDKHQKNGGDLFEQSLALCCISPSAVMIHKSVFDTVGLFDETLPACEDYDLWLRICCRYSILYIDKPLIKKYGGHADQLSQKHWGMDRFRIMALDKLLQSEILNNQQKKLAEAKLKEKLTILLNGAVKHNNQNTYNEFTARFKTYLE